MLFLLVGIIGVEGRVWGTRKRREEVIVEDSVPLEDADASIGINFNETTQFPTQELLDILFEDVEVLKSTVVTSCSLLREMINDESFAILFSPESVREAVNSIPELASNPEISLILNSDEFRNPIFFRETLLLSVDMLETEALRVVSSPQELAEIVHEMQSFFDELSSDMKELMHGLVEALHVTKDASLVPSLIFQTINEDDELMETVRLFLIQYPELLQYIKIPMVALENGELFQVYMRSVASVQDIFNWDSNKRTSTSRSRGKKKKLTKRFPSMFGNGDGVM